MFHIIWHLYAFAFQIEHEGEAKNDAGMSAGASYDEDEGIGSSVAGQASIVGQLRAVEVEIKAVVASIERAKVTEPEEGDEEEEGGKRICDSFQLSHSGRELQHALATDRLKSLKRTKARLQKELDKFDKTILSDYSNNEEQLKNLVKEDKKLKKTLKEVPRSSNSSKKKLKTVSFNDDLDFDAVLDASSAGFIESVGQFCFTSHLNIVVFSVFFSFFFFLLAFSYP